MIVSTVVSAIAFSTIVIVTIVLANQTRTAKDDVENRIRNVVDQVNTAQQYSYEFDKRQQQQVTGLERNVQDVRSAYVTKLDLANKLKTRTVDAENVISKGNIELSGAIQLNSSIDGASKNQEYLIQRGGKGNSAWKNHLVIHTPSEVGAGVNIMSTGGNSRLFVDGNTGQVTVPNNIKANSIKLGDKFMMSGTDKDDWLRLNGNDGKNYHGGIAAANIYTRDKAFLNGNTIITGQASVDGSIKIRGGASEFNRQGSWTEFPNPQNNINYIRGDTELQGNMMNVGDVKVGRNLNVAKNLTTQGTSVMTAPVKINHNQSGWANQAPLSAYAKPGQVGASFGSEGWSHFPWTDGNTYIRPGANNRSINIGDWGASSVNIGKGDTITNINGTLNVNNQKWNWLKMYRAAGDQLLFGMDDVNKGIWNEGPRDFSIYTNGVNRLSIDKDGRTIVRGPATAPSIGRATGDNDWFRINVQNASNPQSAGTAVHQGLAVKDGGGLSVGEWRKMPEGQAYVRDAVKVRHNLGGWTDKAAITTWTPNTNFAGPSFGGPVQWSHFPYFDGNTYIRPGIAKGRIHVGDVGTSHVQVGSADGTSEVRVGPKSWLPNANGHSYIRPGRKNQNVYIGDEDTNEVSLGRFDGGGSVITRPMVHWARRHVDAWDTWDQSGKTIFTGWNSDKTILGNNNTAGHDYVKGLPKNTVASANDLYVNGKTTATNQLCINNTCLNEGDIKKLKSWL